MKEESRRRIARMFLEENFGKNGSLAVNAYGLYISIPKPFELYRSWDSMKKGAHDNEARAFEVMYAPYVSSAEHRMIAVSDSEDELKEIISQCFDKERIRLGLIEFEEYKGYKVAYD
jgi:hypothetical protein